MSLQRHYEPPTSTQVYQTFMVYKTKQQKPFVCRRHASFRRVLMPGVARKSSLVTGSSKGMPLSKLKASAISSMKSSLTVAIKLSAAFLMERPHFPLRKGPLPKFARTVNLRHGNINFDEAIARSVSFHLLWLCSGNGYPLKPIAHRRFALLKPLVSSSDTWRQGGLGFSGEVSGFSRTQHLQKSRETTATELHPQHKNQDGPLINRL